MRNLDKPRSVLIADPDSKFIEILKKDPKTRDFPILIARTGAEAQLIISKRENILAGIFVSAFVEKTNWLSVIKCAHINRPATPIYMINEDRTDFKELTSEDLTKLGVKRILKKPFTYGQMVELISPFAISFDAKDALERAKKNKNDLAVADDAAYTPIRAEDFVSGTQSIFDVYVRLPMGKYLKLLQAGDAFTADRIENYLKKGVTHFFIKKEVQDVYLAYCDHLATAILPQKNASLEIKVALTLNQGEETMKYLKRNGVNESNIRYASKFTNNLISLCDKLEAKENNILSTFMANLTSYEHGVATAMLAGILANEMKIATESPLKIVGMAALLHDIGMAQMPEILWLENEALMDPEQLKLYRTHPCLGAAVLSRIPGMNPAAVQAVEQHHMRLQGKGFPERTGGTPVTRIAEIVGICDELNMLMQKCEKDPNLNIFVELDLHVYPYFTRLVTNAFKSVFYPEGFSSLTFAY